MSSKKNIKQFKNYLNTNTTEDAYVTHTSYRGGRYCIDDKEYNKFLRLYTKALEEDDKNELSLIERHKETSCIVIDLDFRFNRHNETHLYTKEQIKDFISTYFEEIDKYLDVEDDNKIAFVYEIEKPIVDSKNTFKDGIHIIFPHIITKPNIQYMIRKNMLPHICNIFSKFTINYFLCCPLNVSPKRPCIFLIFTTTKKL